ncbi:MAG: anthranilate phosphoribosyltransferase [Candidatus Zixiibacteriota bacterium]|nr:MAG: anthranilate phosphoribosyltransferase [candidate division Zixibacteria bacterium]
MMNDTIKKLSENKNLTALESRNAIEQIMSGQISPVQTAAFLTALRLKGETTEEILGAAQAMRRKVKPVKHHQETVFDNCGTGGDGSGTFNISTTAAFVVAACGVPVAKHGNRSISSKCGSADVLQQLGVEISLTPDQIGECLDELGIGFLFAPNLHPAMKEVAPIRKELGFRTIFNLLGPLTNPAFASHQLIGVFSGDYIEKIADAARGLGIKKVMTVYNQDGIDEITTSGLNNICFAENGQARSLSILPEEFGFARCRVEDLRGGDAQENAVIALSILRGQKGPKRDTVVLGAAVSLLVAEKVTGIKEGIDMASDCIDTGAALEKLKSFSIFTREISRA